MEQMVMFGGRKVLITTAAERDECQAWEWWDEADIVVSVISPRDGVAAARILKGAAHELGEFWASDAGQVKP